MNRSVRSWLEVSRRTSFLWALFVSVQACAPAPVAPEAPTQKSPAPVAPATRPPPAPAAPQHSAAGAAAAPSEHPDVSRSAPEAPTKAVHIPDWTHNGSDASTGTMILRCENAFPPEDGSGKCLCEGYELNVCVGRIRSLTIDRKQCGFVCAPTSRNAKQIALRCPDGSIPEASPKGCACSGRKPLQPCAGRIASATVTAGECVVTCHKSQ